MSEENPVIVTVDVVVVVDDTQIVLIRRAIPPFEDKLVLPGGHVETRERVADAAARELREETGIRIQPEQLRFLCHLDAPDRDPRPDAHRVSLAFVARVTKADIANMRADSDAKALVVRSISSLMANELGFDHYYAIALLQRELEARQNFWNEINENGFPKHTCQAMIDEGWDGTVEVIYAIDPKGGYDGAFLESTSNLGDEFSEPIHFCPACGLACLPPIK